jgi:hypothetical protein
VLIAKPPSRLAANNKALARALVAGPAAVTTSRTKAAASGGTSFGRQQAMAALAVIVLYVQYGKAQVVDRPCQGGSVARLDAGQKAAAQRIAAELADIARSGDVLAGSITERHTRCGRAGCRCMADPPRPHGPYYLWARKLAAKTVGRWLSAEQAAEYRRWTDNHRRLKELFT